MMPSAPVDEEAIVGHVEPPPAEANRSPFSFVTEFLFRCIGHIIGFMEPLRLMWINFYPRAFGEEVDIMPMLPSPLSFIITSLCALAQIKSQGSPFPFHTHPQSMNAIVTSLLIYGLASAAEHFISATRLGSTSVYAVIARLGKISCLCVLVASLSSLFYL